ncbi:2Fe-2S iron-sulfur cluster-binding protein [Sediminitomix flava]|uniref:2Fe-2S ferredoxin n=1 Tax=Sediminitomix flava TaxID=379075 RepID=A0A315ZDR1_SEDFL|nr:2Fe-2S iron-sulfur cluster-binding protein [Sediminitomix flava]PWJ43283.1 2Fe-2S ferredoxin [Sediminitomix flava]
MPHITITNLHNKVIKFKGNQETTILQILQASDIDWMHACGGKGRCTSCKAVIEEGSSNIAPPTLFEQKMKDIRRLNDDERLCCQAIAEGNIEIKVPEDFKFPHVEYSD